jgi:hypothetical protein
VAGPAWQLLAAETRWTAIVRNATAAGTSICRLRLADEPFTESERWTLRGFTPHTDAGEDIRVIPKVRVPYRQDVWVFDRARALWLDHDDNRALQPAKVTKADAECRYWIRRYRDATASPADYLATRSNTRPPLTDKSARTG